MRYPQQRTSTLLLLAAGTLSALSGTAAFTPSKANQGNVPGVSSSEGSPNFMVATGLRGFVDAPTVVAKDEKSQVATFDKDEPPLLKDIKHLLPRESFQVDTKTSLFYFAVDVLAVGASMGFLNAVVTSDVYHSWPVWQQAIAVAPLQVLTGFAMWCTWCIGHDAVC